MSLRFIYGKAGTGKSTFIFNEIKQKINDNNKIYIITPEQFSYQTEKKLLQSLEASSVINAEVISFKRIANRILTEIGGACIAHLTKAGCAMLIYNILEKQKKNLKFLGNSNTNVDLVLNTIKELKKHNINKDKLEEVRQNINDVYLQTKLADISNIYAEYENNILNNYIDENDILTILAKQLNESNMFDNSYIYIDEFFGFTVQEYEIIKQLLLKANQVSITLCTDFLEMAKNKETDIFYSNKQTASKLIDLANEVSIKIDKPIELSNCYRFKNEELKFLEQNLYNIIYKKYDKEVKDINLFLAENPYSQIQQVARTIIKLVREKNYQYKDISIITTNIDSISSIIKTVFAEYKIPVFIDQKEDLAKNILIKYILSLLGVFAKNWSSESIFSYIKSGFLDLEKEEIYALQNYCIKYGIKGNKWYEKNWEFQNENLDKLNTLRLKIIIPLLELKKEFEGKQSVYKITKSLYEFLDKNNIQDKITKKVEKLEIDGEIRIADEYKKSWDILVNVLDEMVLVMKDEKVNLKKYSKLLKTGLNYNDLGSIPQAIDQVILGNVDRSRSRDVKVSIIIDLNDGIFCNVNTAEGFLNDKDRELLRENNAEIAKGTLEMLYDNQLNLYKAFTIAEEKMYLYYLSADNEGKSLRPFVLINKIKKIFPKLEEKSNIISSEAEITIKESMFNELLLNLRKLQDGEEIEPIWFDIYNWYENDEGWKEKLKKALRGLTDTNRAEIINENNIQALYGKVLRTSISRLEQFKKCPFSFYLKYGLKLQDPIEFELKSIDTGSFIHEVIDDFFEQAENIKGISEQEIKDIVESIINEKLELKKNYIFNSTPKFRILTNRLKSIIIQSVQYIVYQIQSSEFEPIGHEVEFTYRIDDTEIIGKVDRIDEGHFKNEKYIRVIDYKSSSKEINFNKLVEGIQLQLITYIDIMSKKEQAIPAGIFYYNLINEIVKTDKNVSDEEIKAKIRKQFKMNGIIIANIDVIKMMDKNLAVGESDIIPISLNIDGTVNKKIKSTITKEEFGNLQKLVNKLIKQISREIRSGRIDIKPVFNQGEEACRYCNYKSICRFEKGANDFKYIGKESKDEILSKIAENI